MRSALDITVLERLGDPGLLARMGGICVALTDNELLQLGGHPAAPTLEQLKEAHRSFQEAYNAALCKDVQKIARKRAVRRETLDLFKAMASNLELTAWNDLAKLMTTGYDLRKSRTSSSTKAAVSLAVVLTIMQSEHRGVLIGKSKRPPGALSCEVQITEGDPTIEENWRFFAVFGSCKEMEFAGLEPGKQYSFRIRGIGSKSVGPWSSHVTTYVT